MFMDTLVLEEPEKNTWNIYLSEDIIYLTDSSRNVNLELISSVPITYSTPRKPRDTSYGMKIYGKFMGDNFDLEVITNYGDDPNPYNRIDYTGTLIVKANRMTIRFSVPYQVAKKIIDNGCCTNSI